jgi:hypothetical protein
MWHPSPAAFTAIQQHNDERRRAAEGQPKGSRSPRPGSLPERGVGPGGADRRSSSVARRCTRFVPAVGTNRVHRRDLTLQSAPNALPVGTPRQD